MQEFDGDEIRIMEKLVYIVPWFLYKILSSQPILVILKIQFALKKSKFKKNHGQHLG